MADCNQSVSAVTNGIGSPPRRCRCFAMLTMSSAINDTAAAVASAPLESRKPVSAMNPSSERAHHHNQHRAEEL